MVELKPPGAYYKDWFAPGQRWLDEGPEKMLAEVTQKYGADSAEVSIIRTAASFGHLYGEVPSEAACHLDHVMRASGYVRELAEAMGVPEIEALTSLHSLHAQGMLLVDDDGSIWMTVPPGAPRSVPGGGWAFVEKKFDASDILV
ncbi:hypothetical protein ACH4PU_30305 [Streptomyces sp. NPDC021100]|uniref:hypothetical protein n=1 Tax=Streptomyces sp. NPDC021100 TaxID=3365114 RepID=UPI0037A527FE